MSRYIAFSMISQNALVACADAADAVLNAVNYHDLPSDSFIEVLDCGDNGAKVWNARLPLHRVREMHKTVFRGNGYADHPANAFPPVSLAA